MGDQRGQLKWAVPLSFSHRQQSLSNGPATPLVVSHRGVLPDNIKGPHSKKRVLDKRRFPRCLPFLSLSLLGIDIAPWLTSAAHAWFPVATAAFISLLSALCPWLWWSVLLRPCVWRRAGTLLGACEEVLDTQKTVSGSGEAIQAWHGDRCVGEVCVRCVRMRHSGLVSMFVLCSRTCCFFCMFGHEAL